MSWSFCSPLRADANAGRVALVTGGGTGIGRATALELARTGARVAICGRRAELLEETRDGDRGAGGECLAVPSDVREPEQVDALVDAVLERFGGSTCSSTTPAASSSRRPRRSRRTAGAPCTGSTWTPVWCLTRLVATRSMIPSRRGARRLHRLQPAPRRSPGWRTLAARAAVENLGRTLALEWGRVRDPPVRVTPGRIRTEGLEGYGAEAIAEWEREVPLGRLGRPEEVASVIAFLASPGGAYVTGTTIVVDGGVDALGLRPPAVLARLAALRRSSKARAASSASCGLGEHAPGERLERAARSRRRRPAEDR